MEVNCNMGAVGKMQHNAYKYIKKEQLSKYIRSVKTCPHLALS